MRIHGTLWGLGFAVFAFLSPVLYIIPFVVLVVFDWFVTVFAKMTSLKIALVAVAISIISLAGATLLYIRPIITNQVFSARRLIILFICIYLFGHLAVLYSSNYDPTEGFNMLRFALLPTQTFWIFILIGIIHDILTSLIKSKANVEKK